MTEGCGKQNCSNLNCASNPNFEKLNNNQAAALAIKLAKSKAELCETSSKSAKQFKPNQEEPCTSMDYSQSVPSVKSERNKDEDDEDYLDLNEDDNDVVVSRSSSSLNLRASSATSSKSMSDALQDAVKYVSQISQQTSQTENNKEIYLSENRIVNLIKKCKASLAENQMDTDDKSNASVSIEEQLARFKPLFKVIQKVYQDYRLLSLSFNFKQDKIQMSSTMPSIAPFNLDFNSLRRSYSLLFSISTNDAVLNELEKAIDMSVYALCVSIRMKLKKPIWRKMN